VWWFGDKRGGNPRSRKFNSLAGGAVNEGATTEVAREAVEDSAEVGPEGTKSRFYGATVLNFMRAALRIGAKYSFAAKTGVNVAR